MSWIEIKRGTVAQPRIYHGVEISLIVANKSETKKLRIGLGEDVLVEMGWERGTKVHLLRGDLADAGILAVIREEDGLKIHPMTEAGRHLVVESAPAAKAFELEHEAGPTKCKYHAGHLKVDADGTIQQPALFIVLPAWARNGQKGGTK